MGRVDATARWIPQRVEQGRRTEHQLDTVPVKALASDVFAGHPILSLRWFPILE